MRNDDKEWGMMIKNEKWWLWIITLIEYNTRFNFIPAVSNIEGSFSRYRTQMNYEMAMEGLQDLPIYNGKAIRVEIPDKKWPGFPQRVSVISSKEFSRLVWWSIMLSHLIIIYVFLVFFLNLWWLWLSWIVHLYMQMNMINALIENSLEFIYPSMPSIGQSINNSSIFSHSFCSLIVSLITTRSFRCSSNG